MASAVGSEMMSKVHKEEEEHGIKIMYKRMYTYIIVPFTDLIYRSRNLQHKPYFLWKCNNIRLTKNVKDTG